MVASEIYSRKFNLIFDGLPENDAENTDLLIDQVLKFKMGMSLNKAEIDKCHRVGKLTTGRSRPLLVRFDIDLGL